MKLWSLASFTPLEDHGTHPPSEKMVFSQLALPLIETMEFFPQTSLHSLSGWMQLFQLAWPLLLSVLMASSQPA
jgi:hypothetical protein